MSCPRLVPLFKVRVHHAPAARDDPNSHLDTLKFCSPPQASVSLRFPFRNFRYWQHQPSTATVQPSATISFISTLHYSSLSSATQLTAAASLVLLISSSFLPLSDAALHLSSSSYTNYGARSIELVILREVGPGTSSRSSSSHLTTDTVLFEIVHFPLSAAARLRLPPSTTVSPPPPPPLFPSWLQDGLHLTVFTSLPWCHMVHPHTSRPIYIILEVELDF
ncbi:hypothetical protein CPC08DRAFT_769598 [Agrocybe pediades]|nr:hypothetical protein CPC08DRAFT_769598 [Agrocybe pediades]